NTTIVTSDATRTVHHDASIVVEADRIVAIGPVEKIDRAWPGAERVEGRGKAVFPWLVNCHTHLTLTGARGITEEFRITSTLPLPTPAEALLSTEEKAVFGILGALECLRGGNTTMLEIGTRVPEDARSVAGTGLRVVFGQTCSDLDPAVIR